MFNASPDAGLSPGNTNVTVQNVLLTIHHHIRITVKSTEYEVLLKSRKMEIFLEFERRVGTDSAQRGKGLRRVDLNGRLCAKGLVRDHSKECMGSYRPLNGATSPLPATPPSPSYKRE